MKTLVLLLASLCTNATAFAVNYPSSIVYEVPVDDGSLRPFSRFEMIYDATRKDGGSVELRYTLPATLLGNAREFIFQGNYDLKKPAFTMKAADAEMNCVTNAGAALCQVVHHGVMIDLTKVQQALESTNLSQAEKQGRLGLARFLKEKMEKGISPMAAGGDLKGVMTYTQGVDY